MKKKIIIGSMLVLTLLLLMPSIPALQKNAIDVRLDTRESELLTKFQDLDGEKIKDLLNKKPLDGLQFLLLPLIFFIYFFRIYRGIFIQSFSSTKYEIINLFIHLRGVWLIGTAMIWVLCWQFFYDIIGLDWPYSSNETVNASHE
jgi:hypothetical protein